MMTTAPTNLDPCWVASFRAMALSRYSRGAGWEPGTGWWVICPARRVPLVRARMTSSQGPRQAEHHQGGQEHIVREVEEIGPGQKGLPVNTVGQETDDWSGKETGGHGAEGDQSTHSDESVIWKASQPRATIKAQAAAPAQTLAVHRVPIVFILEGQQKSVFDSSQQDSSTADIIGQESVLYYQPRSLRNPTSYPEALYRRFRDPRQP